ncbi:hypothetical protein [Gilvibacter sp. SZ-19]|jgi:hypothetical protein|uniref:hypothetical protein n=1 Tax=unclassified Gilvibacter TaxID=2625242 RepID=UPI000B3BF105|nr:hypothetical protein [Gilvibacter sp. SZ-19]ARV11772.1 hypothetical protein BTO09_05175 [Gilvibacter sp. SZ-19]
MKNHILVALAFFALVQHNYAQAAQVQFGRHGACNTGRGICAITTETNKSHSNASLLKLEGHVILRIHTEQLDASSKSLLTASIIASSPGYLKIEKSFQLDQDCQTKLHELGSDISMLNARDYPINVKPGQVDIYLTKL